MDIVSSNPCDALERPRVQVAPPRGLSAGDIRRLLAVIPETPVGLRDRAIILTQPGRTSADFLPRRDELRVTRDEWRARVGR